MWGNDPSVVLEKENGNFLFYPPTSDLSALMADIESAKQDAQFDGCSPNDIINEITRRRPGANQGCALTLELGTGGGSYVMWTTPISPENTHRLSVGDTPFSRLMKHWDGFLEAHPKTLGGFTVGHPCKVSFTKAEGVIADLVETDGRLQVVVEFATPQPVDGPDGAMATRFQVDFRSVTATWKPGMEQGAVKRVVPALPKRKPASDPSMG